MVLKASCEIYFSFECEVLSYRKKLFFLNSSNIFIFCVLCRLERESTICGDIFHLQFGFVLMEHEIKA